VFGLLSQLAHAELESPRPSESAAFFTDVLGLYETERDGGLIYLRGWGDPFHHSLVISEGPAPRIAHVGWRTAGAEALEQAATAIEATGLGEGWCDPVLGHGRAYRFRSPGGNLHEVFWDVDRFVAAGDQRSTMPNRAQRLMPVGAAARQIDHITFVTPRIMDDVAFWRDTLGDRFMEYAVANSEESADEEVVFAEVSSNEQAHDIGLVGVKDAPGGQTHHLAYWVDLPSEVHRAADILRESGNPVEWGPARHGHGENTFLYVREPGGHRIELFSGGYRNYQPDWEPRKWLAESGGVELFVNNPMPESMFEAF
jgi:catechol 2,3-dioxygenase